MDNESNWQEKMRSAWGRVQRFSHHTVKAGGHLSRLTKYRVNQELLRHHQRKLFEELGEIAFRLIGEKVIQHPDLARAYERIEHLGNLVKDEGVAMTEMKEKLRRVYSGGSE